MPQPRKTKRNNAICKMRRKGISLGVIAKAHGIGKTRVVEILKEYGAYVMHSPKRGR